MHRYPMRSSNPSITWSISSVGTVATWRPRQSAESVRIWLIFIQEGWGGSVLAILSVTGIWLFEGGSWAHRNDSTGSLD